MNARPIWDNGYVSTPQRQAPPDEEFLRRFTEVAGEVVAVYKRQWRWIVEACKPLLEWADSPEGRAVMARMEVAAYARGQLPRELDCRCFCGVNHPGTWPCDGSALESEIVTLRFGDHDVPICPPCADARRGCSERDVLAEIDAAVRDWENGPDAMRWQP